jgi:hypothetical protein
MLFDIVEVREQAQRYLEAMYGKAVWIRKPDGFSNVVERWIFAVATCNASVGEECIKEIESFRSIR